MDRPVTILLTTTGLGDPRSYWPFYAWSNGMQPDCGTLQSCIAQCCSLTLHHTYQCNMLETEDKQKAMVSRYWHPLNNSPEWGSEL
ncbi:hypothetical protein PAXRUDRAFT_821151 [Paxillus rubicundulus Ve08.2h10]|uniref:Unplaced genomic scaffold scaffold_2, whole genome shotgun sequence n=1 Tax=Paxillus rubicundulus Ve08.2h10 TaxID=930991 RepID=A0A0D0EDD7_9AGAM|nr:hypothetical protein PAXRUDRAFT_821151 [Paxillus rubicundulus Ve08.2h10]